MITVVSPAVCRATAPFECESKSESESESESEGESEGEGTAHLPPAVHCRTTMEGEHHVR